jgi:hypothetical protein
MAMPGTQKHLDRLKRMQGGARQIAAALYRAGQMIELDAENSITAGSISGKGHVVSAPGQPPNADTAYSGHAVPLEYSTSKMEARPYMRPAVARNRDEVSRRISQAVQITIRG